MRGERVSVNSQENQRHRDEVDKSHVERELARGIASGPPREMTRADWDELKRRVWERDLAVQRGRASG